MKSIIKTLQCFAPYMVRNVQFGKMHMCWTRGAAMEWLSCYDADDFGTTEVFGFTGHLIAAKFN